MIPIFLSSCESEDGNGILLAALWWGLNEMIHVKLNAWCLPRRLLMMLAAGLRITDTVAIIVIDFIVHRPIVLQTSWQLQRPHTWGCPALHQVRETVTCEMCLLCPDDATYPKESCMNIQQERGSRDFLHYRTDFCKSSVCAWGECLLTFWAQVSIHAPYITLTRDII